MAKDACCEGPLPGLQHGLRELRRFLPEPCKRRHQALRRTASDSAHRQNVQRVRQLHAVLPVCFRTVPRQVHALPDEGRYGRRTQALLFLDENRVLVRMAEVRGIRSFAPNELPKEIENLILTVRSKYSYLYK